MTLFQIPPSPQVPVTGTQDTYPVHRIFCVGRNYAAHAREMGTEPDREAPFYFTKSPSAITLSGSTIPYPPGTANYHHEMELVVALGAPLFRATAAQAEQAIYGYACGLDMTRRDRQQDGKDQRRPWDLGKDFEQSAIIAPLTPVAEAGALAGKRIELAVDGAVVQQAVLDDLIHSVPEVLAHLSGYYHLAPGDLIYTGTPAGVGPVTAGQRLEGRIDGLSPLALSIAEPE
ncbi:fumarylacetoacetate hydrolase family protein [Pseudooceanicola aestuarii]|uniref:fumarylacetoacetate hydrolase family protein n=1 Tax=Pseudooceanicola aestuarii TaxID=2697319 RepID=UPI0013D332AD|nr:fumarylacetoacetate hydrolase family protein [Pseudooceanicola aestuarii]